jgi:hypothetical protein
MKTYLLLIVCLCLIGCEDDSNPAAPSDGLWISGAINEYRGGYVTAKAYSRVGVFIQSTIDSVGRFQIHVPAVPDSLLKRYIPWNYLDVQNGDTAIFVDSILIQDSTVRYFRLDLAAESDTPMVIGFPLNQARLTNAPPLWAQVGDYFIEYYYFDSPCLIDGYSRWRVVTSGDSREVTTSYNVSATSGWNLIMTQLVLDSSNISHYEVRELQSAQGKWLIGAPHSFRGIMWKP